MRTRRAAVLRYAPSVSCAGGQPVLLRVEELHDGEHAAVVVGRNGQAQRSRRCS